MLLEPAQATHQVYHSLRVLHRAWFAMVGLAAIGELMAIKKAVGMIQGSLRIISTNSRSRKVALPPETVQSSTATQMYYVVQ